MGFTNDAVVHEGNKNLVDCLKISVLSTYIGIPMHIHTTGLRGIGKTTVMRAFKEILPKIRRIKGCSFNCDPDNPICNLHGSMSREELEKIGTEMIPMPFLEISQSAKPGTVVGGIDIKKLIDRENPEAALLLGSIPRANRGIIFIDEINRLADTSPQVTDILLDVMGTKPGRIQIEEAGLDTIEFPVNVSVWAASNPDEEPGHLKDIRKQLYDRFDFEVNVKKPDSTEEIVEVLCSHPGQYIDAVGSDISMFCRSYRKEPFISNDTYLLLASMYKDLHIESIRLIKSVIQGAKIIAAMDGRDSVDKEDILKVIGFMSNMDAECKEKAVKYLTDAHQVQESRVFDKETAVYQGPVQKWINSIKIKSSISKVNLHESELEDSRPLTEIEDDKKVVTEREIKKIGSK